MSEDEAQTIDELKEAVLAMSRTMHAHLGHATRSVHARRFGLLRGTMEVLRDLPPPLAQELFATPGRYDLVARFSNPVRTAR